MEVEQQAETLAGKTEVREDLRGMNWSQRGDGFEFNDDQVFNEKVDPVCITQLHAFVACRQRKLSMKLESAISEFDCERSFIS